MLLAHAGTFSIFTGGEGAGGLLIIGCVLELRQKRSSDLIVRAVYEQGRLRLLDPVDLSEGQEIQVIITTRTASVSKRDQACAVLTDILMPDEANPSRALDEVTEEAALFAEIDRAMEAALLIEMERTIKDDLSISERIIEKRLEVS